MALVDYGRFAAIDGCSVRFSQLIEHGFRQCPEAIQERYPVLKDWNGVQGLYQSFRDLVGVNHSEIAIASRSSELARLATRRLCESSKRILITDLNWPSYQSILASERARNDNQFTTLHLRHEFTNRGSHRAIEPERIVEYIVQTFDKMGCDGMFIPAISHDGIRLPAESICRQIRELRPDSFLVIDGAQGLGHVHNELGIQYCDLLLAGVHKWLCGHVPMGVAFVGQRQTTSRFLGIKNRKAEGIESDDPLLRFVHGMTTGNLPTQTETVNLTSLFTTQAALAGSNASPAGVAANLDVRIRNADRVRMIASQTGWNCRSECLPTGMVVLQHTEPEIRAIDATALRTHFIRRRISVSTYGDGVIRLAMPSKLLSLDELSCLMTGLVTCGETENIQPALVA